MPSDGNGFQDGADAFATQREFKLPRQPTPHYAVLDLGAGEVVDMNDEGEVLIKLVTTEGNVTTTAYRVWSGGANVTLPETGAHNHSIEWARLGRDPSSNHTIAMGSTQMDFVTSTNATTDVLIPVYCDVTEEEPEAEEPEYAELMALGGSPTDYMAHGIVEMFFGRDGAARWMVQHVYGSGGNATSAVRLATWGPAGLDTEDGPLAVVEDGPGNLTLTIASVPNGAGGEDTLTAEFTNSSDTGYHGFMRMYLNGQEIPDFTHDNIDGWGAFNLSYFRALADRFVRWGDKIVLAPGVTYPSLPYNLIYQAAAGGPLQYMALPADPRVTDVAANLLSINKLGLGLTDQGQFFNSKNLEMAKFVPTSALPEGATLDFASLGSEHTASAANYQPPGNPPRVTFLFSAYLDPVMRDTFGKIYHQDPDTIKMNIIKNPAVILDLSDGTPPANGNDERLAVLHARIDAPNSIANKVYWDLDPEPDYESGELGGLVSFFDDVRHGREVKVFGEDTGRVRFRLRYDKSSNGSNLVDLNEIAPSSASIPPHAQMLDALVEKEKPLKVRIQRLQYFKNGNDYSAAPSPEALLKVLKAANIYMRQAGIRLILDDVLYMPAGQGQFSPDPDNHFMSALAEVLSGGPQIAIYTVKVNPAITNNYIVSQTHRVERFLANNYREGVLQIGFMSQAIPSKGGIAVFNEASQRPTNLYPYIVSTYDDDALGLAHTLSNVTIGNAGTHAFYNDATQSVQRPDLYACALFCEKLSSHLLLIGQTLAHEIGHSLNLRHRWGTHKEGSYDGLESGSTRGSVSVSMPLIFRGLRRAENLSALFNTTRRQ